MSSRPVALKIEKLPRTLSWWVGVLLVVCLGSGSMGCMGETEHDDALGTAEQAATSVSVVTAINAGGPAFTSGDSVAYAADRDFVGGAASSTTSAIANTTDDALYQRWRQGTTFSYRLPLDNGVYDLRLQFMEPTFTSSGRRRFNVRAEGTTIVSNLDVFAQAGARLRALDITLPVRVSDGILDLDFQASVSNALVSAIRISKRTPLALNAGGPAHTAPDGTSFYADTVVSLTGSSQTASTTASIAGTSTPVVYQTNRNGDFTYSVPVRNGAYQVTLKFAESSFTSAGQRVFDVRLEGQSTVTSLDVFAAVGRNRAHDLTFPVSVADGALTVQLVSRVNRAMISAISIAPSATQPTCTQPTSVALVVDQAFAVPLQTELARLESDIATEMGVCVRTIPWTQATLPNAESVHAQLRTLWLNNGLVGAILVGDIPSTTIGDMLLGGVPVPDIPTDTYYEVFNESVWHDINGNRVYERFQDLNGNGQFDSNELTYDADWPERERNIWTGRLLPPASQPIATRIAQLRAYLNRNHAYRTGQLSYPRSMVYFDSMGHNGIFGENEFDEATYRTNALNWYNGTWLFTQPPAQGLRVIWNADLPTQLSSWLSAVQETREYALLVVHGAPDLQQFGPSLFIDHTSYVSAPPRVAFLDLASCDNGYFPVPDYLAGWALFSGDALVVRANSTQIFFVGAPEAHQRTRLLAHGMRFGELKKAIADHDAAVIFGDPTLRMRTPGTGPTVSLSESELVFPSIATSAVVPGHVAERLVTLTNTGSAPITIYPMNESTTSRNGEGTLLEPRFLVDPADVVTFPATLAPGQSRTVRIYFIADAPVSPGRYRYRASFYTNSPSQPVISVRATRQLL